MDYKLGWTQLDGYINGSKRIQSQKEREDRSNSMHGHRFEGHVFV